MKRALPATFTLYALTTLLSATPTALATNAWASTFGHPRGAEGLVAGSAPWLDVFLTVLRGHGAGLLIFAALVTAFLVAVTPTLSLYWMRSVRDGASLAALSFAASRTLAALAVYIVHAAVVFVIAVVGACAVGLFRFGLSGPDTRLHDLVVLAVIGFFALLAFGSGALRDAWLSSVARGESTAQAVRRGTRATGRGTYFVYVGYALLGLVMLACASRVALAIDSPLGALLASQVFVFLRFVVRSRWLETTKRRVDAVS